MDKEEFYNEKGMNLFFKKSKCTYIIIDLQNNWSKNWSNLEEK